MPKKRSWISKAGELAERFSGRGKARKKMRGHLPELPKRVKIKPGARYLNLAKGEATPSQAVRPLTDAIAQSYRAFLQHSPRKQVFVVGIGGAEGTAKTFLASEITKLLGDHVEVRTLAMDDYYKMSRRERKKKVQELKRKGRMSRENLMIFEISNDPVLSDFQTLLEHIEALKQGRPVQKHFYDHSNGEIIRNSRRVEPMQQGILLVEGIYALRKELRRAIDCGVFVFTGEEKKYQRVSKRDAAERAHGIYRSNKYFFEAQLTSYRRYIEPTIRNADIVVNTTHLFD
ncbi:MAG: hypothetical protein JW744_00430 [Candidatus Diapherotrites archaeon]|uniref:Phosphoribulokinase/uridine kinase domain-containing protein n=1 Tax=Candidatus Iainarchaeum sp. TaxID=3101447 RepID=A0A939C470_9ARCH|nr:hypothetical protein [Candidatus Diapherotrites archaeon]